MSLSTSLMTDRVSPKCIEDNKANYSATTPQLLHLFFFFFGLYYIVFYLSLLTLFPQIIEFFFHFHFFHFYVKAKTLFDGFDQTMSATRSTGIRPFDFSVFLSLHFYLYYFTNTLVVLQTCALFGI